MGSLRKIGLRAAVAAGFLQEGQAFAQENLPGVEDSVEIIAAEDAALRAIPGHLDFVNTEYRVTPDSRGSGVLHLEHKSNGGRDSRTGDFLAQAPEMDLRFNPQSHMWYMIPRSDSFNWLSEKASIDIDGFPVDPNNPIELNRAINTVVGLDAVLDRYMGSESKPSVKASSPTDSDDLFGAMFDKNLQNDNTDAAVAAALTYLRSTNCALHFLSTP